MNEKDICYYMNLPYSLIIRQVHDESGSYFYGTVLELEGCQSDGATFEEAYNSLLEAMEGWLEIKLEYKDAIPEPINDAGFSGKFNLRIPKSLHRRLSIEAEMEGISLNQYALYKLAK